jgi:hypothetical protein
MKMRISCFAACVAVTCLGVNNVRAQSTAQVYAVSLSGSLVSTEEVVTSGVTNEVVVTQKFTTANLINLALGQNTTNAVPTNQVLALTILFQESGDPLSSLIVYDTIGKTSLVTVAEGGGLAGAVDSVKGKGVVAIVGVIDTPVGNLTSGYLAATGKATLQNPNTNPVVTAFSASAVQGRFVGNDGEDFDVIISKGKFSLTGQVGTLIIP